MHQRLPSEERPWLRHYGLTAEDGILKDAGHITMWRYLERQLLGQGDEYPALRYFGKEVKRSEFIKGVYLWAKTFRGMGVQTDDKVVLFSPFSPEVAEILCALNFIGAWPILPNMTVCADSLKSSLQGACAVVVADAVESSIAPVIGEVPEIKNIIRISVSDDMPAFLRLVFRIRSGFSRSAAVGKDSRCVTARTAIRRWSSWSGELEAPYDPKRPAIVTSSGGTSKDGYAKQIMDSNNAVVAMIEQVKYSAIDSRLKRGGICYTPLPPFVSTSFFVLFFGPLCYNMTCVMDPRPVEDTFIGNVLKIRPQLTLIPGYCWVYFFRRVEELIREGKKPDLSFFSLPIVGGEGVNREELRWMNRLLRECGSSVGMVCGYGMSEVFSLLSVDDRGGFASDNDTEPVISVGFPMPLAEVGVFDDNGRELGYGSRGELRVKTPTVMLGYYRNEELMEKAFDSGWLRSGDLCSVNEEGMIFVYGRISRGYASVNGSKYYPVDFELVLNGDDEVRGSMILNMAEKGEKPRLVAHILIYDDCADTDALLRRLDAKMKSEFPEDVRIEGYKFHRGIFRLSPVCKIDRNFYKRDRKGYLKVLQDRVETISFD